MEMLMAWRNIRRNPRRTFLTILAIAFACVLLIFMLSLQIGTYEVMIDTSVKTRTGHIQILQQGYSTDHKIRQAVKTPWDIARMLDQTPHITAVSFRSNAFALLSSNLRSSGGFITGIDPEKEAKISSVPQTIRQGRYLNPTDTNSAVVGSLLAKNLKIGIGDELVVLGSAMDSSVAATVLKVTGIFSSGMDEYDRTAIQIPLHHFQDTFAMGSAVHEIIIICDSLWHVGRVKSVIAKNLSTLPMQSDLICMSWDELTPGLNQSIPMGEAEGMMRQYGIPGLLRPKLTLATAVAGPAAVFLITILTALYPAVKVHGIKPVEAIRAV